MVATREHVGRAIASKMSSPRWINIGLLLAVNAMWGTMYFANKWVALGPIATSTWSFAVALPVLLPFLLWERCRSVSRHGLVQTVGTAERSLFRLRNLIGLTLVGILGLLPAAAFMAWGERYTSAANAALLNLSVPVVTAPLAAIVLGERMTGWRWVSLCIALVGALVLSLSATCDGGWEIYWVSGTPRVLAGNALVLLSCLSSCFYNVYSKELLRRFTPLEVLSCGYFLALLIALPLMSWLEPISWESLAGYTTQRWLGIAILGAVVWGLGMVLWMYALTRLDVSLASISIYLLPLFGVLLSAAVLGESITAPMLIGGGVTLLGAVLVVYVDKDRANSSTIDARGGQP